MLPPISLVRNLAEQVKQRAASRRFLRLAHGAFTDADSTGAWLTERRLLHAC
ncbi:hypothetical protein NTGBS_100031 [Candidatus Nitrotoga sp. BS]|nr:hypothetical protein NTGBS_100031 [Candidatus Nitrotoga sp. BS]